MGVGVRFSHVAAAPASATLAAAPMVLAARPAATAPVARARPVSEVVGVAPAPTRDARLFGQSRVEEARVLDPTLFELARPIRVRPVPVSRPGCPAGGVHDHTGSADYTLAMNRAGLPGQSNWRWCRKCQGLAFGGHSGGVCPKGAAHDFSQSGDYVLLGNPAPLPPGYQPSWRWCRKCDGLAYGGGQIGPCPAGGVHDHAGSSDYALPINNANAEGQTNWRWCNKCQGLAFAGGASGATREELALPVASSDPINPDAPFEAATGGARFYLPRYQLARRVVSGSEQYEIRVAPGEDGQWTLRVALAKTRPAGVPADVAATELEHELLLQLNYRLVISGGGSTTKTINFTDVGVTEDNSTVIALMRFASLAERDQVLTAVTSSDAGCAIVATRSVRVAVPVVGAAGRFRPVTRGLPQTVDPDPLFLNPQLHAYLFDGAVPRGGGGPGLVARQLPFEGQFHEYWADAVDPSRIYYLPDAFRLARQGKPSPFTPLLSVRVVPGATADADAMINFAFAAMPWSNTRRLEAARREFAKGLPAANGGPAARSGAALAGLLGVQADDERAARVRMEPVPVEKASFWLALPGAGGGGLVERPAAQVNVRTGLVVSETLPMGDFQTVYDALVGGAVAIMKGEVRCDFGGGATSRVPFDARFDRMTGELLDAAITRGDAPGQFAIALTNAVESPVEVSAVGASLLVGGLEVAAAASFDAALPRRLAPGESLTMTLSPKAPLPAPLPEGAEVEPLLDLSAVKLLLDSEKIWAAILDADTAAEAKRTVRVKLFPGMFDAPPDRPDDRTFAVIVQFEAGPTVELTPEQPASEVKLAASISDIVLRRPGTGGYRYRCQIIRRSTRVADADWRGDSTDLLIPQLPPG
jgi:hypothetical protein